jgi:hypothetical protein
MTRLARLAAVLLLAALATGCRSTYYAVWEQFGVQKRHLLKDAVEDIQDNQKEAGEQFTDALTRLRQMYQVDGGKLEATYDKMKGDYDRCAATAQAIHKRIGDLDTVAADLFKEWEQEITTITSPKLQMDSRRKLAQTQQRFRALRGTLGESSTRMDGVLTKFNDQVLYLKHNLNAQAIGQLKGEADDIEQEIQTLIKEMSASISEADAFIQTL